MLHFPTAVALRSPAFAVRLLSNEEAGDGRLRDAECPGRQVLSAGARNLGVVRSVMPVEWDMYPLPLSRGGVRASASEEV